MAMTNLNYAKNDSTASQHNESSRKEPPQANCHYNSYPQSAAANILSPIFEGEVFPSPTDTISPSLSHNNIDSNHVVLFNSNLSLHNTEIKTPTNNDCVSPTTSISSSNSSNTPTPTTHNTSNSLFNIPCTNNHPPCIPSMAFISKTSSTSSTSSSSCSASPSPSLDTTVSPVTKMDLFRDLIITDEANNNNNTTIDYLTGDKHCNFNVKKNGKQGNNDNYNGYNDMLSPLNSNSLDHKLLSMKCNVQKMKLEERERKKKKKHRRHHRKKKKKRRKSDSSDSDSELQKKGKIRDKIKRISIRVPDDPNGLYKYWKRQEINKKNIFNNEWNKTRDRLNSYPPNNVIYSIKSPHTLSPSSIPPLINSSQSCSNLLDSSIIIHTPINKENHIVLGLNHYKNKKRAEHEHKEDPSNRIRMNSFPPYNDYELNDSKKNGINDLNPYYLKNYYDYDYDYKDIASLPLESLSQPNPVIQSKRPRKNISNHKHNRYNIHPSMNKQKHKKSNTKMTGNLVDL